MIGFDKISIIVPCYNIADYIAGTVRTICNQTYGKTEIILVNDGSTDKTPEILENLKKDDDRIKVIHQENAGVTAARLAGVRAATGEWIGFVDGDDAVEPDMYEHLLKNAIKYDADISHCGYQMVFPDHVDYYYNTGYLAQQDKEAGLKDLLTGSRIEPGLWNKLFHNTLFHSLLHDDVMDLSIKNTEDLLMNYYLFKEAEKSVYEDICPYHYVLREGSAATSVNNENKLSDPLKVLQIIKNELKDEKLIQIVEERIIGRLIALSTMSVKIQSEVVFHMRKDARKELKQKRSKLIRSGYSKKIKLFGIWCSFWPWSYATVHSIYSTIKGTKQKYSLGG